ncbi:hypothetical protein MUP56_00345 [Patescibacteria group bacterium]|nr:hypothetical protein [Patescibacteria group bacterium]
MNTQPQPTQPQPKADRPVAEVQNQPQTSPSAPQQTKSTNTVLMVLVVLLLLVVVAGASYLYGSGKLGSLVSSPTPTPTLTTTPPMISETPTLIASPSVSVSITQKPKPTIIPNPDGNTFTSDKLGIAFYWANKTPADQSATVKTAEIGNKVYVYLSNGKPEDGQSIERFDKSPTDTLSQAITKRFLAGIPTSDCFVKINPTKPKPTVTKATISYPIPADADQPNFTYGGKCPEHYSESNGMAYFFEDSTYPDRFYYVSIGQYGIPAQNSKPDSMWQDTIVVF